MDKWPKEKLLAHITTLDEKLKFCQAKLSDLVKAYKGLLAEKDALESSLKALGSVCKTNEKSSTSSPTSTNLEAEQGNNVNSEITTLMNSLTTLSAEKCRMESCFQAEKKLLRQEKEKNEGLIKELQEKINNIKTTTANEIENLKSKLIIQKHEREKEQNDHAVMMRELQRLLAQERDKKIILEKKLTELTVKYQMLSNKEESDKYKDTTACEKLAYLQKKHLAVLESERKRIHLAEQEAKELVGIYEQRSASLEAKLTDLSRTIADYHRMRQEDQNEITKLKTKIIELGGENLSIEENCKEIDNIKTMGELELTMYVHNLIDKILKYKTIILNANEYLDKPVDIQSLLCDKNHFNDLEFVSMEKYLKLTQELNGLKEQLISLVEKNDEVDNLNLKVQFLLHQNSVLNCQIEDTIQKYEKQIEYLQNQLQTTCMKHDKEIVAIRESYKTQISALEVQVQKQRDRTLALIDEKERELSTLKCSIEVFLPGNKSTLKREGESEILRNSELCNLLEEKFEMSSNEGPHFLHYAHELARRDATIKTLQKTCSELESSLYEINKQYILYKEKSENEVFVLKEDISRLQRCQSREGANLEYLKNVIVNYLLSKNTSSKRHMFNAIAAVLKFSDSEINSIKSTF